MYESVKGSSLLPRESLRQMLIDATIFEGRTDIPVGQLEQWLIDQKELANGMVDAAINQFGSQDNELSIKEFYLFVKTEGTLQYLLRCLIEFIDPS